MSGNQSKIRCNQGDKENYFRSLTAVLLRLCCKQEQKKKGIKDLEIKIYKTDNCCSMPFFGGQFLK